MDGEKETVSLPLRLLVMGDLSNKFDRQTSRPRSTKITKLDGTNLESVMADMSMSIMFSVPNKIDPDKGEDLDVTLPVTSMKSFEPAELAQHIPNRLCYYSESCC